MVLGKCSDLKILFKKVNGMETKEKNGYKLRDLRHKANKCSLWTVFVLTQNNWKKTVDTIREN